MGVLKKDLFDFRRAVEHTKVQFGAKSYWIEDVTPPIPYSTVLTELLNYDVGPYQKKIEMLETTISEKDLDTISDQLFVLAEELAAMPFYHIFIRFVEIADPLAYLTSIDVNAHRYVAEDILAWDDSYLQRYYRLREELAVIQQQYTWFLDSFYEGAPFEKKKGQRKIPLAERIAGQDLGPYVSGVSLGASPDMDAPQVNVQFAMLEMAGYKPEIVEKMYFDRLIDFVYVEFMKGIQRGAIPKRCLNCGKWFLQTPGASYSYCTSTAPGKEKATCREVGAKSSFREKVRNNDVWKVHQRTYKKYFARVRKGRMSKAEFERWGRMAESLRDEALKKYEEAGTEEAKMAIVEELRGMLIGSNVGWKADGRFLEETFVRFRRINSLFRSIANNPAQTIAITLSPQALRQ